MTYLLQKRNPIMIVGGDKVNKNDDGEEEENNDNDINNE